MNEMSERRILRFGATRFDDDGKLVPDGIKSAGKRQRVHEVDRRPDGWYVRLRLDGDVAGSSVSHAGVHTRTVV